VFFKDEDGQIYLTTRASAAAAKISLAYRIPT
jgi:hypothetical protein